MAGKACGQGLSDQKHCTKLRRISLGGIRRKDPAWVVREELVSFEVGISRRKSTHSGSHCVLLPEAYQFTLRL